MKVSEAFTLGKAQAELDFVDVDLERDVPLFVDPFPALCAAITLARLPGMEALFAPFQQAAPHPRPACRSIRPTLLIFGMTCRTLGRAHGR
jgi:hypothetical protein